MHFKMTELVRRFLLRRNMSSSKMHCYIDLDKTMQKKVLVLFSLRTPDLYPICKSSRPLSPPRGPQTSFQPTRVLTLANEWINKSNIHFIFYCMAFPWASQVVLVIKNLPANAGDTKDMGSLPGQERSPGRGNADPLQYSRLENPTDRGAWWTKVQGVAKSHT